MQPSVCALLSVRGSTANTGTRISTRHILVILCPEKEWTGYPGWIASPTSTHGVALLSTLSNHREHRQHPRHRLRAGHSLAFQCPSAHSRLRSLFGCFLDRASLAGCGPETSHNFASIQGGSGRILISSSGSMAEVVAFFFLMGTEPCDLVRRNGSRQRALTQILSNRMVALDRKPNRQEL